MTGAAAVTWFRNKREPDRRITLQKPDNLGERREAEQAVRESSARGALAENQRGAVARAVASLVEVRERNHFADSIRAALLGSEE